MQSGTWPRQCSGGRRTWPHGAHGRSTRSTRCRAACGPYRHGADGPKRATIGVPIAADESAGTLDQARRVVAARAADVLVVKPMLAGGPRAARAMIELALQAGLGAIVTTTLDRGVGVALALHLAACLPPPAPACGLTTSSLLAADLVKPPLRVERGQMRPPGGPGLGVILDERQIERYCEPWQAAPSAMRR